MVFPGLTPTNTGALSSPPVAATNASYDYDCNGGTSPSTVPYNENPAYLILPLQNDYRASDTATSLSSSSNLVSAVGGVTGCNGVQALGGQGTFYAGVIDSAQSYLYSVNPPPSSVKNVIILLSDGDANANSTEMAGRATTYKTTNECTEAVDAAQAARSAGTLFYAVSYNTGTSGCSSGEGMTPCSTMAGIATPSSSNQYFFSVPLGTSTVCSGARSDTTLNQVFTDIGNDLSSARLLPPGLLGPGT